MNTYAWYRPGLVSLAAMALMLALGAKVKADDASPAKASSTASETVDSVTSETTEMSKDQKEDEVKRDIATSDQVFTPEYQDRINAAQQAEDEQKKVDRARHDKLIDYFMKH